MFTVRCIFWNLLSTCLLIQEVHVDYDLHRYLWVYLYSRLHLLPSNPPIPFANCNFLTRSVNPFHFSLDTHPINMFFNAL